MRGASVDAVVVEGARKRFGEVAALDGVDLAVPSGELRALLGPNGAGKTTLVRALATLSRLDGGRAEVAGVDVAADPAGVRARIGVVGQHAAVDEVLTGRANLRMFARLHHLPAAGARRRADELLDLFGLVEAADRPVSGYSGGMRRRLDLAAGMVLSPAVLFLDEPTTGLDPRGRAQVWDAVRELVRGGTTVLMTTQYLDEADQLADRVTVLERGRVLAEGTPAELKARVGGAHLVFVVQEGHDLDRAAAAVAGLGAPRTDVEERRVDLAVAGGAGDLVRAVRALDAEGIEVADIALRAPTLDEAFLALTGQVVA
ncbi:ATP-binding cassette domain-containing protein [Actinokineospora sp. G85]|uniref:ATP-binding cassette domain-containing protein n=1 Tax=Actinokineospora sp. G85 TaxID=3406626 RepID=UPI003C77EB8E